MIYKLVDQKPELGEELSFGHEVTSESLHGERVLVWNLTSEYWMNFELHEGLWGVYVSGSPPELRFTSSDRTYILDSLEPTKHSLLLSGFIKWDGCTQWWHHSEPWHYDYPQLAPDLRSIIEQVVTIARREIPRWDTYLDNKR